MFKNTLLTGRGYPPLLQNDEIPLLVWIDVSHAVLYANQPMMDETQNAHCVGIGRIFLEAILISVTTTWQVFFLANPTYGHWGPQANASFGSGGLEMRHFGFGCYSKYVISRTGCYSKCVSSDSSADSGWVGQDPRGPSLGGRIALRTLVGWGRIHADPRWEVG